MEFLSKDILAVIGLSVELVLVMIVMANLLFTREPANSLTISCVGFLLFQSIGILIRNAVDLISNPDVARALYYFTLCAASALIILFVSRCHRINSISIGLVAKYTVSALKCYSALYLIRYIDRYSLHILDGVYSAMIVTANVAVVTMFIVFTINAVINNTKYSGV